MDWYYHDPGQGRVGPLSADAMRTRYRERRIQQDTLFWREGMREWQPLERVSDQLELLGVQPDAALPPPLPPGPPPGVGPARYASPVATAPATPGYTLPPRRGMSGCLIALIVAAVIAVPMLAIIAAIALPAYQDYTLRAKVAAQVEARAPSVKAAVAAAAAAHAGECPASAEDANLPPLPGVDFGTVHGHCAFSIRIDDPNPKLAGRTVVFVAPLSPGAEWDCTGGDLPARYRSQRCRPEPEGPTP